MNTDRIQPPFRGPNCRCVIVPVELSDAEIEAQIDCFDALLREQIREACRLEQGEHLLARLGWDP